MTIKPKILLFFLILFSLSFGNIETTFAATRSTSSVEVDQGDIVWDDNSSGNYEIYFKYSNIGGDIWSQIYRMTWNIEPSISPKATIDNLDDIHIVWSDKTPGNYEILYKAYIFGHILKK